MGLLGGLIVYGFGKRRGRRQAERQYWQEAKAEMENGALEKHFSRQNCVHYHKFCRQFGSCDGLVCEEDME